MDKGGKVGDKGVEGGQTMANARKTVMIVDDDPTFRTLVRRMLEDEYEVVEVGHPKTALATAIEKDPHCILMDIDLPEISGVELCTILGEMSATRLIPIIVVTGHPAARAERIRQVIQFTGFLRKPFEFEELKELIAGAVGRKQEDRRREGRVRLPVPLRIVGRETTGQPFDASLVTYDVSVSGFSCHTNLALPIGSSIDVSLAAGKQPTKGQAMVVRVEKRGTPEQRYGFQFFQKPENWVLR
jgi:CheY-like chemotaxis protein